MSIDRIGKGSGGLPVSGIQPSPVGEAAPKPTAEFKVSRAGATEATSESSLDRLRAGQISLPEYLDIKVHEATAHLDGRLGSSQLAFIRDSLREQLAADPALVDMVKAATGALPPAGE